MLKTRGRWGPGQRGHRSSPEADDSIADTRGLAQCHRPRGSTFPRSSDPSNWGRLGTPRPLDQHPPARTAQPARGRAPLHHLQSICSRRRLLVDGCLGAGASFILLISRSARFSRLKFLIARVTEAPISSEHDSLRGTTHVGNHRRRGPPEPTEHAHVWVDPVALRKTGTKCAQFAP